MSLQVSKRSLVGSVNDQKLKEMWGFDAKRSFRCDFSSLDVSGWFKLKLCQTVQSLSAAPPLPWVWSTFLVLAFRKIKKGMETDAIWSFSVWSLLLSFYFNSLDCSYDRLISGFKMDSNHITLIVLLGSWPLLMVVCSERFSFSWILECVKT